MPDYSDTTAQFPGALARTLPYGETHDDATDRDSATPVEFAGAHGKALALEMIAVQAYVLAVTGLQVTDNGGIQVAYSAGRIRVGNGAPVDVAASTVNLTDNDTNYVEVNAAGTVSANTSGFTAARLPLATVLTSGADITSVTDDRSAYYLRDCSEPWSDTFDLDGHLDMSTGAYDLLIKDNEAAALEVKEGSNAYLTFVTTNSGEQIVMGSAAGAVDFKVFMGAADVHVLFDNSAALVTYTGAKLRIGTAAGTGPSCIGTDPDQVLQCHGVMESTATAGAYAGAYNTFTVTAAQDANVSVFGTWSELYITGAISLAGSSNYAAHWANLEMADGGGALTGPGGIAWMGALVGSIIAPDGLVNNGILAGVIADSNLTAGYTNNGTVAGMLVRKGASAAPWPYGLYVGGCELGAYFNADAGTITGEVHGLDVDFTGTLSSGDAMVGANVEVTPTGTAAAWVSGLYAKVTQGESKAVNGYLSGAEFEVINAADNVSDWFPLVLNAQNNGAQHGSHASYLALRDYGSTPLESLLWINDVAIATNDANKLISSVAAPRTHTHSLRMMHQGTPYYFMMTSTGG